MDAFHVWVHPMDHEYCVLVEGLENANWLVAELGRAFVFKTARPMGSERGSRVYSFQVPLNALLPYAALLRVLARIPGVNLVPQSALA